MCASAARSLPEGDAPTWLGGRGNRGPANDAGTWTSAMEDRRMDDNGISPPLGNGMAGALDGAGRTDGEARLPPLPIGIASFPEIRDKGYVYVDKTEYIADLLENTTHVFCARPRRFGKSLTLSTIATLFSGQPEHRALFEGLAIAPRLTEPIFKPRPVIHLIMSAVRLDDKRLADKNAKTIDILNAFESNLFDYVHEVANKHKIIPIGNDASSAFRNFITQLHEKSEKKIVLLIDEYDNPLIESMLNMKIQDGIRTIMRSFYIQVKNQSDYLSFTFFTGITKFSKVGIFSELNILNDISINERYAAMYGYTQEELDKSFGGYIDSIANKKKDVSENIRKGILEYYDGYTFDGCTHVYNPISILQFMNVGDFHDYWIQTGSQQFVEKYFHGKDIDCEKLEGKTISYGDITSPKDVGLASSPKTVLYQSGYMTIRKTAEANIYKLIYPNLEVRNAMRSLIVNNFFKKLDDATAAKTKIQEAIDESNYEEIINIFNRMLSGIPEKHRRTTKDQDSGKKEDFYNGQIARFLLGAGFDTQSEDPSNKGIADIVAKRNGKALVIEGKYVDLDPIKTISRYKIESDCRAKLSDAVSQIYNQNYADKYGTPMRLAIVYDESRAARISHVAYNETAFHLYGKKPDFNEIGKVLYDGLIWKLSYTAEITASKEPLSPADILAITMSKKAKCKKKTHSQKTESSNGDLLPPHGKNRDLITAELLLCKAVLPANQYLSWSDSLVNTDDDDIINKIHKLAVNLTKIQSAEFWHSLSQEKRIAAFHDAVHAEVSVLLRYITRDGNFCLTAVDTTVGESIGLLITMTGDAAYGPYPLSRLRENVSSLIIYDPATKLEQICKDNGIKVDAPLPTPEDLLKWDEKK
jgi:hypothetical protein